MIKLDELERHARAYLPDENRRAHPAHVQAYYGNCGPDSMLALIRVARAAKVISDSQFVPLKFLNNLDEALKEIE
jgi:hypothetical protein